MAGNLADLITSAKFQGDIYHGYDFTGGQISHFPIDFRMGLTTVQRYCAACDEEKVSETEVFSDDDVISDTAADVYATNKEATQLPILTPFDDGNLI